MNRTKIEWTDFSWNPIIGCSHVSEGCVNCYAVAMANRLERMGKSEYRGLLSEWGATGEHGVKWSGEIRYLDSRLDQPIRRRKPSRIFVCSMSDLFHDSVPVSVIADIFNVMACATPECGKNHRHEDECWTGPPHTFLILTKRPGRALKILEEELPFYIGERMPGDCPLSMADWPLPNVWLGVTCENQALADQRIPILLQTPAALRFVSCEPMLQPITLPPFTGGQKGGLLQAFTGATKGGLPQVFTGGQKGGSELSWVICGGETGPHARPFNLDWARSLRHQCQAAGIPFFMKQGGKIKYESLPADLQIREFPCT